MKRRSKAIPEMIVVHSLRQIFPGRPKPALDGVSFIVEPGQIFGLLGPNGAGKTTLVRILSTLLLPTGGTATICGYDVVRAGSRVKRSIGLAASSERSFYFRLTGYQNLEFFGGLLGLRGPELKKKLERALEMVGLSDDRDVLFMKYSGGMKRKLALARSLLADPPVYLLDEPTTGIDPVGASRILEIIRELRDQGKTILLTTHDMKDAEKLSDVVGILKEGRLIAVDTPAHLRSLLQDRKMVITLIPLTGERWPGEVVQRVSKIPGVSHVTVENPHLTLQLHGTGEITPLVKLLADSRLKVESIGTEDPTLEDVFSQLTE